MKQTDIQWFSSSNYPSIADGLKELRKNLRRRQDKWMGRGGVSWYEVHRYVCHKVVGIPYLSIEQIKEKYSAK